MEFNCATLDIDETVQCEIVQYADDITLVTYAKEPEAAVAAMDLAWSQLEQYAKGNRLAPRAHENTTAFLSWTQSTWQNEATGVSTGHTQGRSL